MQEQELNLLKNVAQDVAEIESSICEIRTDIAVLQRDVKHNRETNLRDYKISTKDIIKIGKRISTIESNDIDKQSTFNQFKGAKKIAISIWGSFYGFIVAGVSGGIVYIAMKIWG